MKAITTLYLGPTDHRGARITAFDLDGNRATVPYPYELSGHKAHRVAVKALMDKMGWTGVLSYGALKNGYAWTFFSPSDAEVIPGEPDSAGPPTS